MIDYQNNNINAPSRIIEWHIVVVAGEVHNVSVVYVVCGRGELGCIFLGGTQPQL